jgi:hypothetical protein
MKKIIQGKRYDTEKATLIGVATSFVGKTDFRWFLESLYVTPRSGVYFVHGQGGPMSRWSQRVGNGYSNGEGILPLNREDALRWAEQHLSPDDVEKFFGDVIEDA